MNICNLSKIHVEFSGSSARFEMLNDNRICNPREPIGNDHDRSTTKAYPNITNSLSGPNPNIAPPNQSMNLDASAAMASVLELERGNLLL